MGMYQPSCVRMVRCNLALTIVAMSESRDCHSLASEDKCHMRFCCCYSSASSCWQILCEVETPYYTRSYISSTLTRTKYSHQQFQLTQALEAIPTQHTTYTQHMRFASHARIASIPSTHSIITTKIKSLIIVAKHFNRQWNCVIIKCHGSSHSLALVINIKIVTLQYVRPFPLAAKPENYF